LSVTRLVVLLRAINVGKRQAPMAELREACRVEGFEAVESYIQSGNLVLSADAGAAEVEAAIEKLVLERFGFHSDTIARTAGQWAAYARREAFPEAAASRPKALHLCLSKRPLKPDAAERLVERAALGERALVAGDALWVDFAGGVGASKLTPALIDRATGSPTTARNWNTVLKLHAMASG
jgi:uncharacterized protein (DUF1697 family)